MQHAGRPRPQGVAHLSRLVMMFGRSTTRGRPLGMICMGEGLRIRRGQGRRTPARLRRGELQSRMRRCYNWPDYGTSFAGVRAVLGNWSEMTGAGCEGESCACLAASGNSGLARVFAANREAHVSGRRSWKPCCSCEWPATCLTTAVPSRTGRPYGDRAKGKTVDELDRRTSWRAS
jgi:hypothetical protein